MYRHRRPRQVGQRCSHALCPRRSASTLQLLRGTETTQFYRPLITSVSIFRIVYYNIPPQPGICAESLGTFDQGLSLQFQLAGVGIDSC